MGPAIGSWSTKTVKARPSFLDLQQARRVLRLVAAVFTAVTAVCFTGIAVAVLWLHIGIRPVLSGSMRPTYAPGWAIVTRQIPLSAVRRGDIIVFTPPGSDAQFAHRVTSVSGPANDPIVTTKGDANPSPDAWHLRLEGTTVPEVVTEVPWLGSIMVDFEHQWEHAALIALLGLGICFGGTKAILRRPGLAESH